MILAQIDIEPWHVYTGAAGTACYAALRIWTAVRKQKQDEKRDDAQTKFYERTAMATEESGRHLAAMNVKLDHVCRAECRNFDRKTQTQNNHE